MWPAHPVALAPLGMTKRRAEGNKQSLVVVLKTYQLMAQACGMRHVHVHVHGTCMACAWRVHVHVHGMCMCIAQGVPAHGASDPGAP